LNHIGNELPSIVRTNVLRNPAPSNLFIKNGFNISALAAPPYGYAKSIRRGFVLDQQCHHLPTCHQSILNKVHAFDLVWLYCRRIDRKAASDYARTLSPLCYMAALVVDAVNRVR